MDYTIPGYNDLVDVEKKCRDILGDRPIGSIVEIIDNFDIHRRPKSYTGIITAIYPQHYLVSVFGNTGDFNLSLNKKDIFDGNCSVTVLSKKIHTL